MSVGVKAVGKKATFDLDGVLLDTVRVICARHDIPYEKIEIYSILDNEKLTDAEKKSIIADFKNVEVYREAVNKEALEMVDQLTKYIDIEIHSFCASDDVIRTKREIIERYAPNVKALRLEDIGTKDIDKDISKTTFIVEDRVDTLVSQYNDFEYACLIEQPYNVNEDLTKYPKIHRVENPQKAVEFIMDKLVEMAMDEAFDNKE